MESEQKVIEFVKNLFSGETILQTNYKVTNSSSTSKLAWKMKATAKNSITIS